MKTEITEFCANYTTLLRHLAGPLQKAVSQMDRDTDGDSLRNSVARLKDVQHRLDALVEKLDGQKAYLLIFGPLKSGKSTLMNAIGGAYVSEVTAMPAYPALVYLGHGEKLEFTLTSYEGSKQTLRDGNALKSLMLERHRQLADQIRELETQGVEFDPGIHSPKAIRRIDVRVPVPKLKEGSTILVDTPGLYSRMKFGYDLMTRTFRNSAACAVFVVKTDNLFLEQVFEEFNELLELFSRIFLVVNIDSRKLDLQPDGSLSQSIEGEDPERIIEAFKSLSMTAPLRLAMEEGRLRIYPIDLLLSASNHLQAAARARMGGGRPSSPIRVTTPVAPVETVETNHSSAPGTPDALADGASADATQEGEGAQEEEQHESPAEKSARRFDQFIADLTEYLNSSAYLAEFVKDSLNQGSTLNDEIARFTDGDTLSAFRQRQAEIAASLRAIKAKLATAKELEGFDLRGSFGRVKGQIKREATDLEKAWKERTVSELHQAVDQWMEDSDSLRTLIQNRWSPILRKNYGEALAEISSKTALSLQSGQGGADIPDLTRRQIQEIGMSLEPLLPVRAESTAPAESAPAKEIRISDETIPVRRTLIDRILFRRQAAVRSRLFGPPDNLDNEITPKAKQKRLLPDGKEALKALAQEQVNTQFASLLGGNLDRVDHEHIEPFCRRFTDTLASIKKDLVKPLSDLENKTALNASLDEALKALRLQVEDSANGIEKLVHRFSPPPPPPPAVTENAESTGNAENNGNNGEAPAAPSETPETKAAETPTPTPAPEPSAAVTSP